jgi:hypothetical protein
MRFSESQSFSDQLNSSQKKSLSTLKNAICTFYGRMRPGGQDRISSETPTPLINLLETWLLDDEQKQSLTASTGDIFFLYATAYLLTLDGLPNDDSPRQNSSAANPEGLIHLVDLLKTGGSALGVDDARQAEIMGMILEGYLAADRMGEAVPPQIACGSGEQVHIQFLAAGLRLAMGFNLSAPATLKQLVSLLPPGTDINATALPGHFTVDFIGAHPNVQATVLVRLDCHHAEVHRALKRYEAGLQRLLYHLNRIVRPRFLFTAVQFEITPAGYQPIDFKFNVDTSSALQLFAGNTLYKDRRVFLRELIQNAVDACNLRRMYDPGFTPAIGVEFSGDLGKITVRDNGIGMSKQWIEKYFLNIGLSFYQSDEITRVNRDANIQLSFISQFGIGFLSSFLVARQVVIKTRQAGSDGFLITVSHIDDYFDVRVVEETIPVGTEVTVILKENKTNYCRSMEYRGYLKTNVRFLPIKIDFTDEKGDCTILGQEPLNYEDSIRWGTKLTARLAFNSSEGYLLMRVKENHQYIYDLETSKGGVSVFQDGIFITQVDNLLPDSAGEYVVGRLNLVGDEKCRLSMDRNRLLWDKDQLATVKKRVLYGLVTIVNRLLETSARQDPPENVHHNMIQKLGTFFDFNEVDDVIYDRLNPALRVGVEDQFRMFIRIHHSRYDMLHNPASTSLNAHGYINNWQQAVIEGLQQKGAGKIKTVK